MEEQPTKAQRMSRSTATLIVGLGIALVGFIVKAIGEGQARGAAIVAEITGGPADASGVLAYLIGAGMIAIGGLMVAAALVWKLIAYLSGD